MSTYTPVTVPSTLFLIVATSREGFIISTLQARQLQITETVQFVQEHTVSARAWINLYLFDYKSHALSPVLPVRTKMFMIDVWPTQIQMCRFCAFSGSFLAKESYFAWWIYLSTDLHSYVWILSF